MPTKLSDYFTLEEFTVSEYAARNEIDNSPSLEILAALARTAHEMDKVRRLLGRPVSPSSGYRCQALERGLKRKPDDWISLSQHTKGEAVDFICPGFGNVQQVFDKIRLSGVEFDQLIAECGRWVHISFAKNNRRECLSYDGKAYQLVR